MRRIILAALALLGSLAVLRKRALDRPEKLHLSFRLSALVAASHRFCQRAALRHQLLASLFQVCNVIHCRSSRVSRPEHYRTGSATPSPAYAPFGAASSSWQHTRMPHGSYSLGEAAATRRILRLACPACG